MPLKCSQVKNTKYKYTVSNVNPYILPIRNWFKFTRTKRLMNNDKWAAETTSSGSEFQILSTRTAKKCCLQLTLESGKNNLNEWPRVLELQTNVKKARPRTAAILNIEKIQYLTMMQNGSLEHVGCLPPWIFKIKFLTDTHRPRYICSNRPHHCTPRMRCGLEQ